MRKVWRFITSPFRFIWRIITWPFRSITKIHEFMTFVPEDRELTETIGNIFEEREAIFEQIDELRKHLLRSMVGLALAVIVAFAFTQQLVTFLAVPLPGGLESLQTIEVTESFSVFMRLALVAGLAIAMPYIVFELWLFVAPGLMPRSRQYGLIAIPLSLILFVGGMAFTYYVMLGTALPFLRDFLGVRPGWSFGSYFRFVTGLLFWIGLSFEFPLLIYALTAIGLLTPKMLIEQWRIAVVVIAILAAIITPTVDPMSMTIVMVPMTVLYFVSIGLSAIAHNGRVRSQAESAV